MPAGSTLQADEMRLAEFLAKFIQIALPQGDNLRTISTSREIFGAAACRRARGISIFC
jgi:hypothetical protein